MTNGAASIGDARGRILLDAAGVHKGIQDAQQAARSGFSAISDTIKGVGTQMSSLGGEITKLTAPLMIAGGAAVKTFVNFDEAMTNIQAVTGRSNEEIAKLSESMLEMGSASRFGPQAVAESMYDVVGGVADASIQMDILTAAVHTAEAGNANLNGTTKALISTMNSYAGSGMTAAEASDILTRTVGVGVGTMDEFAAALPQVTGLANSLGISFEDVGAQMAFLTTKGYSASQSATMLRGMMTAMLNPNEKMKQAFQEVGFASAEQAIKMHGLVGAYQILQQRSSTFQENMAGTIGSVEALGGVIAMTSDGATEALDNFSNGLEGATEKAREIQNNSPAAMFDRMRSQIAAVTIELGAALVPVMEQMINVVQAGLPILSGLIDHFGGLIGTVGMAVAGLSAIGPVLIIVGKAVTTLGSVIGLLMGPVGWAIAIVGVLYLAWRTNFLGIQSVILPAIESLKYIVGWLGKAFEFNRAKGGLLGGVIGSIRALFYVFEDGKTTFFSKFLESLGMSQEQAQEWGLSIVETAQNIAQFMGDAFNRIAGFVTGSLIPTLQMVAGWFVTSLLPAVRDVLIGNVLPLVRTFLEFLGQAWAIVGPALGQLYEWFVSKGLPDILGFISGTAVPAIGKLIDIIRQIFEATAPYLLAFLRWFVSDGFPGIVNFIRNEAIPAIGRLIDWLKKVWDDAQPKLEAAYNWFVSEGLPAIRDFIRDEAIPAIEDLIGWLKRTWDDVQPKLQELYLWFMDRALPEIKQALISFKDNVVAPTIEKLKQLWDDVSPKLAQLYNWIVNTAFPWIANAFENVKNAAQRLIDKLSNLWNEARGGIEGLRDNLQSVANYIKDNIIDPLVSKINTIKDAWNDVKDALGGAFDRAAEAVGFQAGGYTGDGNADEVAGVTHGQEWVIPRRGSPVVFAGGLTSMVQSMQGALNRMLALNAMPMMAAAGASGPSFSIGKVDVLLTPDTLRQYPDAQQYGQIAGDSFVATVNSEIRKRGGGVGRGG